MNSSNDVFLNNEMIELGKSRGCQNMNCFSEKDTLHITINCHRVELLIWLCEDCRPLFECE